MDAFSNQIINSVSNNQTSSQDTYEEINLNTIDSNICDDSNLGMAVNMSNLNSQELTEILKQSPNLSIDFFRFGLYRTVDSNVLYSILKIFKIAPQDIESMLEYISELRDFVSIILKSIKI